MYADIMGGMNAQRKENTANRRDNSKLFADYVKSQREQGIDLTEQGMTEQWNNHASGVGLARGRAPTRDRMKGIMAAQQESIAEEEKAQSFKDFQNDQTVNTAMKSGLNDYFNNNAYSEGGNGAGFQTVMDQFGDGSLMGDALTQYTDSGRNFGLLHNQYNSSQLVSALPQVTALSEFGMSSEEIKANLPNIPASVIEQAIQSANQTKERDKKKYADGQQTLMNQNRNAAMLEVSQKVALGDVNEQDVQLIMEKYGIEDPAIMTYVTDHYQLESQRKEQAGMEATNTTIEQRLAKSQINNAETITGIRKDNKENSEKNFNGFSQDIQGAVDALSNKYAIDGRAANIMVDYINSRLAEDPNAYSTSRQEIMIDLKSHIDKTDIRTYENMKSELDIGAVERIGIKQFTPKTFERIYIGDMEYQAEDIISRMERASESGDLHSFKKLKAALALFFERQQHDLSLRGSKQQQAFGSYASTEEVHKLLTLASDKISEFSQRADGIATPKDTTPKKLPASATLVSDAQKRIEGLKNGKIPIMGNFNSVQPFALDPDSREVKAEIERLQKIIDHNS